MPDDHYKLSEIKAMTDAINLELESNHYNVEKVMEQIITVLAMLGRLSAKVNQIEMREALAKTAINVADQVKTYGGKFPMGLIFTEFGIELGAAFTNSTPLSYLGQSVGKFKSLHDEGLTATRTSLQFNKQELEIMQNERKDSYQRSNNRLDGAMSSLTKLIQSIHEFVRSFWHS